MLKLLSGKAHKVYTGVSIVALPAKTKSSIFQESTIYFRHLSDAEVEYYASTAEPMDKAGSYALQGAASAFVERIEGCYSNVIGLPVSDTVQLLRQHGVEVMGSLSTNTKSINACQQ
jgi:septum formation protein